MLSTREIVERYYEYVNSENWAQWLTLFSDDVVGDEQLAGHFAGIAVLEGAVKAISRGYSTFKMFPVRVVVEGESACVVWRNESANAAGIPIAYPAEPGAAGPSSRQVIGANYFQVQNGKIVYMRTIHDSRPFDPFTDPTNPKS